MVRFVSVLSLALLMCVSTPWTAGAERLPLSLYSVADGLAHNDIKNITRDSRGFLWVATAEGLSRFDGYTFSNYGVAHGLPSGIVNALLETRDGELWVATNQGLAKLNPRGQPGDRLTQTPDSPAAIPPMFTVILPEDPDRFARMVTALWEARDGTIWCGTLKHLYRLERRAGRAALVPTGFSGGVLDIVEDRRGRLWIASFRGLFRRSPDGRLTRYTVRDGLPDNNIHDLLEDRNGQLWAGTRLTGLFRFSVDDDRAGLVVHEIYGRRQGLPADWVLRLHETADGHLMAGTDSGLVELLPAGDGLRRPFRAYTRRHGLALQEVTALTEDKEGNLWLGTGGAGAMKLARHGFTTYDERDGLASVNAILEDGKGDLCFRGSVLGEEVSAGGASVDTTRNDTDVFLPRFGRFDGRRFEWFAPKIAFNSGLVFEKNTVRSVTGEWWVGSGAGLYRFPSAQMCTHLETARAIAVYTKKDGLVDEQIWRVFSDSGGNIWVSGISAPRNGLARWDRASQRLQDLAAAPGLPSLAAELPSSFAEDRGGHVWVGLSTGVARYQNGRFVFFTASDGLPAGAIMDIHSDRAGRLWLASTRGGLIRVDDPTAERPSFSRYTSANGLSSDGAAIITGDLDGRIYVATGRGLDQLDPDTGNIKHFTTADGLAPGNIIAAFCDRHGALWFGTHRGLSRFIPPPKEAAAPAPPVLVTGLTVGGQPYPVSAVGESDVALPDLSPGRNQLQVDFVGLGFATGERLKYQYLLDGSDAEWSQPAVHRRVNYANLAPGQYRFRVRALNADGVASPTPAVVAFTILPPVWQRWWFVSLAALVVVVSGYAAFRYRVGQLVELERVRMRIASDLHDDIGANLTKISILSEVARHRHAAHEAGDESALATIARISRESVAAMNDIVWAISPRRDTLADLVSRMRLHAEETCVPRAIALEFTGPDQDGAAELSADTRRDLYLIFKEAVNNAARHANCTRLEVALAQERKALALRVCDDGCGFDPTAACDGNGVANMRRRAEARGALLDIASGTTGTTVRLKMEMSKRAALLDRVGDRSRPWR